MGEENNKKNGTTPNSQQANSSTAVSGGAQQTYAMDEETGEIVPTDKAEAKIVTDQQQASGGEGNVATTQQPAANPYLADWASGVSVGEVAKSSDKTYIDLIRDRERWARETGGTPMDVFDFMPLGSYDLGKSHAENEADEKKRQRKEKWDQVANALSQLGNFIGPLGPVLPPGAIETPVEFSKRQQMLREKTEQLRRTDSRFAWEQLMKQRADQRAADVAKQSAAYQQHRMEIDERKADLAEKREDRMEAQMWLNEAFRDRKMNLEEARQKALEAYRNGQLSQGAARIAIARMNAGGYTTEVTDTKETAVGTVKTTKTTTKTPNGGGGGKSLGIGIRRKDEQQPQQGGRSLGIGIGK